MLRGGDTGALLGPENPAWIVFILEPVIGPEKLSVFLNEINGPVLYALKEKKNISKYLHLQLISHKRELEIFIVSKSKGFVGVLTAFFML